MDRTCNKCHETKPLAEFPKSASNKYGRKPVCKKCMNAYHRAYHAEHHEERNAMRRMYHTALPDWTVSNKLQEKFGITLDDYNVMLKDQGGGCAICGKTPEENGRRLAVDHNHESGAVRGLLCISCNRAIGLLQDDADLCLSAASYLHTKEA